MATQKPPVINTSSSDNNKACKVRFVELLISFCAIIFCASLIAVVLAWPPKLSLFTLFKSVSESFYHPVQNFFAVKKILNNNIHLHCYIIFNFSMIVLVCIRKLFLKLRKPWFAGSFSESIFRLGLILFFCAVIFQTVGHIRETQGLFGYYKKYMGKTTEERIALFYKNSYHFARYCQKRLPGKHWAKALTDIDLGSPEGLSTSIAVAYYLYPIDIRVDRDHPKDCLVLFVKDNPKSYVPKNYEALDPYDEMSLLAIKKR